MIAAHGGFPSKESRRSGAERLRENSGGQWSGIDLLSAVDPARERGAACSITYLAQTHRVPGSLGRVRPRPRSFMRLRFGSSRAAAASTSECYPLTLPHLDWLRRLRIWMAHCSCPFLLVVLICRPQATAMRAMAFGSTGRQSCSQTLMTVHPACSRRSVCRRSRSAFASSFGSQYEVFVFG
jgi:hypothetical protein